MLKGYKIIVLKETKIIIFYLGVGFCGLWSVRGTGWGRAGVWAGARGQDWGYGWG